jgi:ribosomal protein S18 acetylase RimI-like enzyme
MPGYASNEKYEVHQDVTLNDETIKFFLRRVVLHQPYVKNWDYDPADILTQGSRCVDSGLSLGAFDNDKMVAIALAEVYDWNGTLWIPYFGVAAAHRRQGIGIQLMDNLAAHAQSQHLRVMVAETQTTNMPAIRFYRKAGFTFDAIDLSYYTNRDIAEGEVAIFMKRKLDQSPTLADRHAR